MNLKNFGDRETLVTKIPSIVSSRHSIWIGQRKQRLYWLKLLKSPGHRSGSRWINDVLRISLSFFSSIFLCWLHSQAVERWQVWFHPNSSANSGNGYLLPQRSRADSHWFSLFLLAQPIIVAGPWVALIGQAWIMWLPLETGLSLRFWERERERSPKWNLRAGKGKTECHKLLAGAVLLTLYMQGTFSRSETLHFNRFPGKANAAGSWTTLCGARATLPGLTASLKFIYTV